MVKALKKEETTPPKLSSERLNFRLIIVIPTVFILVSLSVGLLSMTITQLFLNPPIPSTNAMLFLRLTVLGLSFLAGVLGAMLAYGIVAPIKKAILGAKQMIRYVEPNPPPIRATDELGALSTLMDQALTSVIELVQAREMLDTVNEGIITLDMEGKIASINLMAQELFGISLTEARNQKLADLLGQNRPNSVLLTLVQSAPMEREERLHNRVPFRTPTGKMILLSVKVSPLRLKKEQQQIVGVILNFKEVLTRSTDLPDIVGRSEQLAETLDLAIKVGPTDSTVLLLGESGTGKELIADAIHRLSRRKDKPFIKLNCAAIPEGLLESELFGHEKGAFTGATARKPGKFELADGGTIFLDEIGDMSPSTQPKVLRVIEQKEFTPVGGTQTRKVDVRIIAATNKDIREEVRQGRLREDLFFRLNVVPISTPPLRERKSDIPFLADHFLEEVARKNNTPKKSLSRGALDCLLAYSWPGNIRELENVLERAFFLSNGPVVQPEELAISPNVNSVRSVHRVGPTDLPVPARQTGAMNPKDSTDATLNETLQAVEKDLIIQALKKAGGIQVEAAKVLGLEPKNLWHKIRKHKIDVNGVKNGD